MRVRSYAEELTERRRELHRELRARKAVIVAQLQAELREELCDLRLEVRRLKRQRARLTSGKGGTGDRANDERPRSVGELSDDDEDFAVKLTVEVAYPRPEAVGVHRSAVLTTRSRQSLRQFESEFGAVAVAPATAKAIREGARASHSAVRSGRDKGGGQVGQVDGPPVLGHKGGRSSGSRLLGQIWLLEPTDQHDGRRGRQSTDPAGRLEPAQHRHRHVKNRQLGLMRDDRINRLRTIVSRSDHTEATILLQQTRECAHH
jgi:hypothetical protein